MTLPARFHNLSFGESSAPMCGLAQAAVARKRVVN
jgi:hypothetical protein